MRSGLAATALDSDAADGGRGGGAGAGSCGEDNRGPGRCEGSSGWRRMAGLDPGAAGQPFIIVSGQGEEAPPEGPGGHHTLSRPVQRARLWASTWTASQAPSGKRPWLRPTFEVMAISAWSARSRVSPPRSVMKPCCSWRRGPIGNRGLHPPDGAALGWLRARPGSSATSGRPRRASSPPRESPGGRVGGPSISWAEAGARTVRRAHPTHGLPQEVG